VSVSDTYPRTYTSVRGKLNKGARFPAPFILTRLPIYEAPSSTEANKTPIITEGTEFILAGLSVFISVVQCLIVVIKQRAGFARPFYFIQSVKK